MKRKIPKSAITERELRKQLKRKVDKAGSMTEWATKNKITPQAVSAFVRKIQTAGLQIPEALGYKPQIIYIPLDEEPICHMNPPRRATKRPSAKVDHTREPVEKRGLSKVDERKEAKRRLKRRAKS